MPEHNNPSTGRARLLVGAISIITGMTLIGLAIWGGPVISTGQNEEMSSPSLVWFLHFACGALTIFAVGLAQSLRFRRIGQIVMAVAGAALLFALTGFFAIGPRAIATVVLPAVVLLVSSVFLGPLAPRERIVREARSTS
jgi:hypothetical protein